MKRTLFWTVAIGLWALAMLPGCTESQTKLVDSALDTLKAEIQKPKTAELAGQLAVKIWLSKSPSTVQIAEAVFELQHSTSQHERLRRIDFFFQCSNKARSRHWILSLKLTMIKEMVS